MQELRGKVAAITGAGSGFGREFARLGARLGMRLALCDVQSDALAVTVTELTGAGAELISDIVDVADSSEVKRWSDRVYEQFGDVHCCEQRGLGGGGYMWEPPTAIAGNWVSNCGWRARRRTLCRACCRPERTRPWATS